MTGNKNLKDLRWIETETFNFSSGGALICLPSLLAEEVLLLLNFDCHSFNFPSLVLGQVRHCNMQGAGQSYSGLEFIVKEGQPKLSQRIRTLKLPSNVFAYTRNDRNELNKLLAAQECDIAADKP
jgi:hypothetical protein